MPRRPREPRAGAPEVVDVLAQVVPVPAPVELPPVVEIPTFELLPDDPAPAPRPAPESTLTPEQRRIRDLENQLAVERGRKDPEPELEEPAEPGAQGNILIHFVAEGFTALGMVWRRGQELEFVPGSPAYRDTCDRFGRSWLELRDNEQAQVERFKEVKFRSGPWLGKSYAEVASAHFERLKPLQDGQSLAPTEQELRQAALAEARRNRAAPRLPVH